MIELGAGGYSYAGRDKERDHHAVLHPLVSNQRADFRE